MTEIAVQIAKLFAWGRSQLGRRIDTEAVRVGRRGRTSVLGPIETGWEWLDRLIGTVDDDFAAAALEPVAEQDRPDLDRFR